jgi:hypothetical protein
MLEKLRKKNIARINYYLERTWGAMFFFVLYKGKSIVKNIKVHLKT